MSTTRDSQYRHRAPIEDFRAKDKTSRPSYFPNIILHRDKKREELYRRSQEQIKLLSQHKYAVKGRS